MVFEKAFNLFLVDRESYCSGQSLVYYRFNVQKFVNYISNRFEAAPDQLDCSVVTRDLVLEYITFLRSTGCKNTSINTYFRAVKTFLNYCIDEGYCNSDCLRKIKFLKDDSYPVIPLTQWEVNDIDGCYSDRTETGLRNLCIMHLMLDAGFRMNDVISLTYKSISFTGNYLMVKGKGDKFRTVYLCPKLKRMLYHYLIKFRNYSEGEDYPVFVKVGSTDPINENVIKQFFARLKKKSGIERLHPHLLRHTFATSYMIGGGNLEFLRLMLGHSSYDITKLYLHLAQQAKMLHSDIYKLDPIFFKSGY